MKQLSIYRVIRIDLEYDDTFTDKDAATDNAVSMVVAEAKSNADYNGFVDDVRVTDVVDCGESV